MDFNLPPMEAPQSTTPNKISSIKSTIVKILVLLLVVGAGFTGYTLYKNKGATPGNQSGKITISSPSEGSTVSGTIQVTANVNTSPPHKTYISEDEEKRLKATESVKFTVDVKDALSPGESAKIWYDGTNIDNADECQVKIGATITNCGPLFDNTDQVAQESTNINVGDIIVGTNVLEFIASEKSDGFTIANIVIDVSAQSSTQTTTIPTIEIFVDGKKVGQASGASPYSLDTTAHKNGKHVLTASFKDGTNTYTSPKVPITVKN